MHRSSLSGILLMVNMDGGWLRNRNLQYANPYKVPGESEAQTWHQLCEVGQPYMIDKACDMVGKAEGMPILFQYGADGTPVSTVETAAANVYAKTVVRNMGRAAVFLLQRCFIQTCTRLGGPLMSAIV